MTLLDSCFIAGLTLLTTGVLIGSFNLAVSGVIPMITIIGGSS